MNDRYAKLIEYIKKRERNRKIAGISIVVGFFLAAVLDYLFIMKLHLV